MVKDNNTLLYSIVIFEKIEPWLLIEKSVYKLYDAFTHYIPYQGKKFSGENLVNCLKFRHFSPTNFPDKVQTLARFISFSKIIFPSAKYILFHMKSQGFFVF